MRKHKTKYILGKVSAAYDFGKLDILKIELFEMANKFQRYKCATKKQHLKPIYSIVCFLSSLLAELESAKTQV